LAVKDRETAVSIFYPQFFTSQVIREITGSEGAREDHAQNAL
jgi:hypothetical protein